MAGDLAREEGVKPAVRHLRLARRVIRIAMRLVHEYGKEEAARVLDDMFDQTLL